MLEVTDIHLYHEASHVLRGVSFSAALGKVTCLMGRNGVGKTSALRAVMGLDPIRRGRIRWDGQDVTALPVHQRAQRGITLVPQGRDIFPRLSVRENLETGFACLPARERALPPEIFELFPVLATMLHRRGGDLSGGQQQQLAIARALVTRPRMLILDEPTEGIQPSIITLIEGVIGKLAAGGTMAILLVEQYFEFARDLADAFVVMDRGAVVLAGSRAELIERESDVRRFLTV
ncbi:MAG: urea ABC transporter ATP-binding subunit UrtE [Rhodospirillaceae bacterium]